MFSPGVQKKQVQLHVNYRVIKYKQFQETQCKNLVTNSFTCIQLAPFCNKTLTNVNNTI